MVRIHELRTCFSLLHRLCIVLLLNIFLLIQACSPLVLIRRSAPLLFARLNNATPWGFPCDPSHEKKPLKRFLQWSSYSFLMLPIDRLTEHSSIDVSFSAELGLISALQELSSTGIWSHRPHRRQKPINVLMPCSISSSPADWFVSFSEWFLPSPVQSLNFSAIPRHF